jgi:hypothetical protein
MRPIFTFVFTFFLVNASSALGQQVASRIHSEQQGLAALNLTYDFEKMKNPELAAQNLIIMNLNGYGATDRAAANVIVENLADKSKNFRKSFPLERISETQVAIHLTDIEPHKVYRLWITLHKAGKEPTRANALGYVRMPHYLVSWSPDGAHERRRLATINAVQHYYSAKMGWWGNMDCWAFTQRYLGPHFPSWNRQTHYGSNLPNLQVTSSVIGDYVRIPDYHSLIVLAYDVTSGIIWSVEGNFNSTIEVVTRNQFNNWWVTHH